MLNRGELGDATVLQPQTVQRMWEQENVVPVRTLADSFGLAFMRWTLNNKLVVGHDRSSFHELLHRGHILDFLLAHGNHRRSVPLQIFFEKIEFAITQHFPATCVICLGIDTKKT